MTRTYDQFHDVAMFTTVIARMPENDDRLPGEIAMAVLRLRDASRSLSTLDEAACNYDLAPRQQKRQENLEALVMSTCEKLHIGSTRNHDPRGYSVLFHLPGDVTNDFGRRGFGFC